MYHSIRSKPGHQISEERRLSTSLSRWSIFSLILGRVFFEMDLQAVSASRPTINAALLPLMRSTYKSSCLNFYPKTTNITLASVDCPVGEDWGSGKGAGDFCGGYAVCNFRPFASPCSISWLAFAYFSMYVWTHILSSFLCVFRSWVTMFRFLNQITWIAVWKQKKHFL